MSSSPTENLTSYLNEHLAGSIAAIALLEHLQNSWEGTPHALFAELREEVEEDQDELRLLLNRISKESTLQKAAGWVAGKFVRHKIHAAGEDLGDPGLLEALEILAIGITGKRLLWTALRAALAESPLLAGLNLENLEARAVRQFDRVEAARLEAARAALACETAAL